MYYNIIFLLLFLFSLIWTPTLSNEICVNDLSNRKSEYKESDLVLLGEIEDFKETDKSFKFKILDIYKGFHPWHEINIEFVDINEESTNQLEEMNGYWIIYANRTGINTATVKFCGASRNFQNRTYLHKLPPPPEYFKSKKDSLEYYVQIEKLITKHQKEWINEVLKLKEKEKDWNNLLLFVILISIALNVFLIIKIKQKPVANTEAISYGGFRIT